MQHRLAFRREVVPSTEDGKPIYVFAIGYIIAIRPGLPSPQPVFAAIFLAVLFLAIPEVRNFAMFSVPAGIVCGCILYALRKWRQRNFPTASATPLGL
ncbi:MAG: hypothetical protein HYX28_05230 [Candidatus Koribacter versatilis]|uniref:Uncharacterized protein n=1 Tax=Candidatus Korobacter versatilis TaxID=658062 RepID=A0A932EP95_9BACT|nr:hypothetical protein [Candidatus Koribacter versatilis]